MPFYTWNPAELGVKVPAMDQEHQTLIAKMNHVYDTFKAGKPRAELDKAIEDFAHFTVTHFKDEEAYMEEIKFGGLATHRIIHQQLLAEVNKHLDEFKKTGTLSDKFFNFLSVWLTSHIRGIDAKYGAVK